MATGVMLIAHVNAHKAVLAVHGTSALLLVMIIIGHAYLGTLATPGNWQVLFTGKVSREWAEIHHSEWDI